MISACMNEREIAMKRIGILAAVLTAWCAFPGRAGGTTIDPRLWEQLVWEADLIVVAQCTTAGGVVAEYRVLESWKGGREGETIRIRISPNYWEPQFPVALVGERYLFTAYKSHAPSRLASFTPGGPVPLWWREIEFDYRLPLFQGRRKLFPEDGWGGRFRCKGDEELDVSQFRAYVKELLAMGRAQRELLLLRLLGEKYFTYRVRPGDVDEEVKQTRERLLAEIFECGDAGAILETLLDFVASDYEKWRHTFRSVVTQGVQTAASWEKVRELVGGSSKMSDDDRRRVLMGVFENRVPEVEELSLAMKRYEDELQKKREEASKRGDTKSVQVFSGTLQSIARIQRRETREADGKPEAPTAEQLAEFREQFRGDERKYKWGQAFVALSDYEPATVAEWLVKWTNPRRTWSEAHRGYELGSLFAWKCGGDRKKHLVRLLKAREDYVRVAAATYLVFEDEKLGLKHLRKCTDMQAEAGRWAMVNLARRGDKRAMDAAVEAFDAFRSGGGMVEVPGRNLSKRVLVLLSNSAKHSGLEQRQLLDRKPESVKAWWKANRSTVRIHDPWLEGLAEQKVD